MALDPRQQFVTGHLIAWVCDAELELIRFTCTWCGATTEPLLAGQPVPPYFSGVPHTPDCQVYDTYRRTA